MKSSCYVNHPHKTCICFSVTPMWKRMSSWKIPFPGKQNKWLLILSLFFLNTQQKNVRNLKLCTAPFVKKHQICSVEITSSATKDYHLVIMYDVKLMHCMSHHKTCISFTEAHISRLLTAMVCTYKQEKGCQTEFRLHLKSPLRASLMKLV